MPRKILSLLVLAFVLTSFASQASLFENLNAQQPSQFASYYKAIGEKAGCRFPTVLDGWKKVSPLESLAANRSEGTIEVVLKNPVLKGSTIYISQEPAQVNGALVCLAKFIGKAEGNLRRIVHYNPATRKFDGPEEIVTIMPRKAHPGEDAPNTSVELIEKSGLNTGGWYLYGKKLKKTFLVKALEPRLPLLVRPTVCISDVPAIKDYATKRVFDDLRPGMYRTTLCADDQPFCLRICRDCERPVYRRASLGYRV